MSVIETTLGTGHHSRPGPVLRIVERLLRAIIPAANPDFDSRYEEVCKWWIEIGPAGEPVRELGFNEGGEVIVAAPLGENFGFFTDSDTVFVVKDYTPVEHVVFDAAWTNFERIWEEGRHRPS